MNNYTLVNKYYKTYITPDEKDALFEKIINDMQKNKTPIENPLAFFIMGHPGSTKSTFTKNMINDNTIVLDVDIIKMNYMPDYKKNMNIDYKKQVSKYINEKATLHTWFFKRIVKYFIKKAKYNLIFENVCSYLPYCSKMIKKLNRYKYTIKFYGLHMNDFEKVKEYLHKRFLETGRYIPKTYIEDTYKSNLERIYKFIEENLKYLKHYEVIIF